ncbi:hydroquinone glucosyltransferase [Carex littledalei]|uniref:Hydroquinone glucosyltransferase n=1 Tax=Carex littledalei TaxID=544730 RepID=A0A833R2Q7_9POAL|nr:hydroquinone glucosyltransferase [Carex littledalei]
MENGTEAKPHIVLLATPGMGHLIPLAELAKLLVTKHGFTATLMTFASTASKTQQAFLSSLPSSISPLSLPAVSLSDLPPDSAIETLMSVEAVRLIPAITSALNELKTRHTVVGFVADLFGADTFDAAHDAGLRAYLFFPTNLLTLSLLLHLPEIDANLTCDFKELSEPVQLPGCVPVPGTEILSPLQDRSKDCYKWMVHHGQKYREAEAILVNSFDEIEPHAAKILRQHEPGRPPVYPIGPLIQTGSTVDKAGGSECLDWLDKQPTNSVLYVSFGSGGTLTKEQMDELAYGLESSGQRFLWVVRSPTDADNASSNYYDAESKKDPFAYLPEGFRERTKERGMVVSSRVPQIKVLAHEATGGYVCHCGWNSTLETVVHGVPIIAWPLFAEQKQNAVLLSKGARIALPLEKRGDGVVEREEIERKVRALMEGEEGKRVRRKVAELKEAAAEGMKEGGAACQALAEVVEMWKKGSG